MLIKIKNKKEQSAKSILQYFINDFNSIGWSDDGVKFSYEKVNKILDNLEVMLLIYNIFADKPLEVTIKDDKYILQEC